MTRTLSSLKSWMSRPRNKYVALVGVVAAVLVALGVPMFSAASPSFFAKYHLLSHNYDTLETSSHKGIACNKCHLGSRGPVMDSIGASVDFYANLPKKEKSPVFAEFPSPTNEACLSCHESAWSMDIKRTSKIPHPAHLRVSDEKRECVKCHKWTAHEEAYMQKHKKMPFSGVCVAYGCHVGTKTEDECSSCHHVLTKEDAEWKVEHPKTVRAIGPNGCLESCHEADQCRLCHTTGKTPQFSGLAVETGLKSIERLHAKPTWMRQHGAQALLDQAKCMKCHVSDGECRDCHAQRPAFHGSKSTWIGQHSKTSKDVEDPRCLACHKKAYCEDCHKQFKEMR